MTDKQKAIIKALRIGRKTVGELYAIISPGRAPRKSPSRGGPDGAQVTVHFYCARHLRGLVSRVLEPKCTSKPDGWYGDRYELTEDGRVLSSKL